MPPEHYAKGINIQAGIAVFSASKSENVSFSIPFATIPDITLTLDTSHPAPPYRINVTVNGFTIKFQANYTGSVAWEAI